MKDELGKRAEEIINGPTRANEAVRHFDEICSLYGHDAEVQRLQDSNTEIGLFFYNDAGRLAETPSPYEIFLNQYQIASDDFNKYSFSIETWQDKIPYIKITLIK
jgi:hypothetical protein